MKRITASQARQQWFRLLDEAAAGQVIVVERNGERIVIQRQKTARTGSTAGYRALLRVRDAETADRWSWQWTASGALKPTRKRA